MKEFTRPTIVAIRKSAEELAQPRSAKPIETSAVPAGWRSRVKRWLSV